MINHFVDAHILFGALRPYPGSKIFETCLEKGIVKDKLDFYEHIDENPWNMLYNMTSVPDKKWLPLLDSVVAFGQLFPWVKTVVPYHHEVDLDTVDSPVALYTGKQIYKIWAKCPHCGSDIYCRELLALEKGVNPEMVIECEERISFTNRVTTSINLVKDAIMKAIRLSTLYYLSFVHPIYRLLRSSVRSKHDLFWDSFLATVWFCSGCPDCKRRIKITIPVPFTMKAFSFVEIKRRFKIA